MSELYVDIIDCGVPIKRIPFRYFLKNELDDERVRSLIQNHFKFIEYYGFDIRNKEMVKRGYFSPQFNITIYNDKQAVIQFLCMYLKDFNEEELNEFRIQLNHEQGKDQITRLYAESHEVKCKKYRVRYIKDDHVYRQDLIPFIKDFLLSANVGEDLYEFLLLCQFENAYTKIRSLTQSKKSYFIHQGYTTSCFNAFITIDFNRLNQFMLNHIDSKLMGGEHKTLKDLLVEFSKTNRTCIPEIIEIYEE